MLPPLQHRLARSAWPGLPCPARSAQAHAALSSAPDWSGAKLMPMMGRTTFPNLMICSSGRAGQYRRGSTAVLRQGQCMSAHLAEFCDLQHSAEREAGEDRQRLVRGKHIACPAGSWSEATPQPGRRHHQSITGGEGRHNTHTHTWSTLLFTTSTGMANPTPALLPAVGKPPRRTVRQHGCSLSSAGNWRSHATAAAAADVAGSGLRCQGSTKAVPPHLIGCRWQYLFLSWRPRCPAAGRRCCLQTRRSEGRVRGGMVRDHTRMVHSAAAPHTQRRAQPSIIPISALRAWVDGCICLDDILDGAPRVAGADLPTSAANHACGVGQPEAAPVAGQPECTLLNNHPRLACLKDFTRGCGRQRLLPGPRCPLSACAASPGPHLW